jgi:ribose transport system permease protein
MYSLSSKIKKSLKEYNLVFLLIILLVILAINNPKAFFNMASISSILRLSSIVGIATIGQSLVLLTKGVDLSVGAIMGLTSILIAIIIQQHGTFVTIIIVLFICTLLGLINGLFIVKGKIPAIITTLGMMWFSRGLAGAFSGGRIVRITNESFISFSRMTFMGIIPYMFVVLFILGFIVQFVLIKYPIGRHIYAIGGMKKLLFFQVLM